MCSNHRKDEGMCGLIRGRVGKVCFYQRKEWGKECSNQWKLEGWGIFNIKER